MSADRRHYGEKYRDHYSTKDIARLFREDVAAGIAAGEIPQGLKLSIRTAYNSIQVTIVACPGVRLLNAARILSDCRNPNPHEYFAPHELPIRSIIGGRLLARLEHLLGAYNYDGSQLETDYFDVRFYGHPSIDDRLERAECEAVAAAEALSPIIGGAPMQVAVMREYDRVHRLWYRVRDLLERKRIDLDHEPNEYDKRYMPRNWPGLAAAETGGES